MGRSCLVLVAAAGLLAGCDVIWRLDEIHIYEDARDSDAHADAIPDANCNHTASAMLVADGFMTPMFPNTSYGNATLVQVDSLLQSTGIWKFQIPFTVPLAKIVKLELTLRFAAAGDSAACGSCSAGMCNGNERAGVIRLHALTSDWDESTFTFRLRRSGQSWMAAGANVVGNPGSADRSTESLSLMHAPASSAVFTIDPPVVSKLVAWHDNTNALSFLVQPVAGSMPAFYIVSNNYVCPTPPTNPASLAITYCP